MKKVIYAILICIIIAGAVVIGVKGLKTDIVYGKNVRIDVYIGKECNKNEIEQMAKEIFGTDRMLIQSVEYFDDMFSITMSQDVQNMDENIKKLNEKINEKYDLKNEVDKNIKVEYQPKIRLSNLLKPYIMPIILSLVIILVYAAIRFKNIGIMKTVLKYILAIIGSEAVYLSLLAIFRVNIDRIVIPMGLLIYVISICFVTLILEREQEKYKLELSSKSKN